MKMTSLISQRAVQYSVAVSETVLRVYMFRQLCDPSLSHSHESLAHTAAVHQNEFLTHELWAINTE